MEEQTHSFYCKLFLQLVLMTQALHWTPWWLECCCMSWNCSVIGMKWGHHQQRPRVRKVIMEKDQTQWAGIGRSGREKSRTSTSDNLALSGSQREALRALADCLSGFSQAKARQVAGRSHGPHDVCPRGMKAKTRGHKGTEQQRAGPTGLVANVAISQEMGTCPSSIISLK